MPSIRRRLILWLLPLPIGVMGAATLFEYLAAGRVIRAGFDQNLVQFARIGRTRRADATLAPMDGAFAAGLRWHLNDGQQRLQRALNNDFPHLHFGCGLPLIYACGPA